jgi:hypothetical protein
LGSDSVSTLYSYDPEEGYRFDQPLLEPWAGYWIYNADLAPQTLFIAPKPSETEKAGPVRRGVFASLGENDWVIRFSLESDGRKDPDNGVGVRTAARNGWDGFDRPEPPAVDDRPAFFIENITWGRLSGCYATDIRAPGELGYVWEGVVQNVGSGSDARLAWERIGFLPESWKAFLFDREEGTSRNLADVKSIAIRSGIGKSGIRRFKIVVGSESFIQDQSEGIPLHPVAFALHPNYPNPFNAGTTIRFDLDKRGEIVLTLFNTLGQEVKTLVRTEKPAGNHSVYWDGTDAHGRVVSSGMYLVELRTPDHRATRKLIVVR